MTPIFHFSNKQNLLLTMDQVLCLLEVFILAHYGPPSTETPTTTKVRCHKNSWIYLTSAYYWWLLRPTITIQFDSKWKYTIHTALVNGSCFWCRIIECVIEMSLQRGNIDNVKFIYNTGPGIIFGSPYYAAALEKLATSRYCWTIRDVISPPVHLYIAVSELVRPFDNRMMPWKFCHDISNGQGSCGSLKVLESVFEGPWKCLNLIF